MMFREVIVKKDGAVTPKDCSLLVEHAMRFGSEILLEIVSKHANAKSIMSVLNLGLHNGGTVTIIVKGDDERDALDEIARILTSGFRRA